MEHRKQETQDNGWMSVPAFGDWDMKNGVPDYSMDFSKIREKRKQNKSDFSRASLGNEEELVVTESAMAAIADVIITVSSLTIPRRPPSPPILPRRGRGSRAISFAV